MRIPPTAARATVVGLNPLEAGAGPVDGAPATLRETLVFATSPSASETEIPAV
jgi:hypothetical protein